MNEHERATPMRLLQRTAFVSSLDRFAMPPLLVAMAADLDVPLAAVVHAAGAYFVAYGCGQPLWGVVSDRFGVVPTMRTALLLGGVFAALSALAWSAPALGLLRGMAGFFLGAAFPSTLIYLGDTVPPARRQHAITQLMTGVALGTAVASVGAGLLADLISWRWALALCGLASISVAIGLRHLPSPALGPRTTNMRTSVRMIGRSRAAAAVLAFGFVEGAVLLGGLVLIPPALEYSGAPATLAGGITALYGVAVLGSAPVVGRLAGRLHPAWLIASGAVAVVVAWVLLAWTRQILVAALVVLLVGFGWSAMHTSLQAWATEVQPQVRATVVSLFAGCLFAGSAAAAAITGRAAQSGRFTLIFGVSAIVAAALGIVASTSRWRWHPRRPGADS